MKLNNIPYGMHDVTDDDIDNIVKVLRSDYITQGQTVCNFERSLCLYTGAKYSTVVSSCTSALHIACLSLGLKKGDVLWTSPISFVASANCALYCGASVDFVDIDYDTGLMSISNLVSKLEVAEKEGRLPKIIIPVHFSGQSCDMKSIHSLGKKYGFKIIEDAAHALGAKYSNTSVGCCKYSDMTVFSFHPVKMITTGEGGAIMCNNNELDSYMKLLRSHGITRENKSFLSKVHHPKWYYEQIDLGFNYRMTDIQAALGISQIERLDRYVDVRGKIALLYDRAFANISDINPLKINVNCKSSYHLYVVRFTGKYSKLRDYLYEELNDRGILVNMHYIPIYRQPFYDTDLMLNEAERHYSSSISLPIFPLLNTSNQQRVINEILDIVNNV